ARRAVAAACAIITVTSTSALHAQDNATTKPDSTASKAALPLKAERTLRFTTREGTWMSVDVSPDGRQIVFDLLGDLYLLPIEGGQARRLTSGMAYDAQPRFSPDGRKVLFVSDRSGGENLWTIDVAT